MNPIFWILRGVPRLCGIQKSCPGDQVRKKLPRELMARYAPELSRTWLTMEPEK